MNIQNSNNFNNFTPQFGALHVASSGNLNLYRLNDSADFKFIKSLQEKVDLESLMPGLTKDKYSRWKEMIEYAKDNALKPENVTYVETCDNKICGIITYTPDKTTKLDCICTWPVEKNQKVACGGKLLFLQLFKDFAEYKGTRIKLDAITNGPFDVIKKYMQLGFQRTTEEHPTKVKMEINKYKINEVMNYLQNLLHYTTEQPSKINLQNFDI